MAALTSPLRVVNERRSTRACGTIQIAIVALRQGGRISTVCSVEGEQGDQRAIGSHLKEGAVGGVHKLTCEFRATKMRRAVEITIRPLKKHILAKGPAGKAVGAGEGPQHADGAVGAHAEGRAQASPESEIADRIQVSVGGWDQKRSRRTG